MPTVIYSVVTTPRASTTHPTKREAMRTWREARTGDESRRREAHVTKYTITTGYATAASCCWRAAEPLGVRVTSIPQEISHDGTLRNA